MSRLPRRRPQQQQQQQQQQPLNPLPSITPPTTMPLGGSGVKRKASEDLEVDDEKQPRKLPALSGNNGSNRPVRPVPSNSQSRSTNLNNASTSSLSSSMPPPTLLKPPPASSIRVTRSVARGGGPSSLVSSRGRGPTRPMPTRRAAASSSTSTRGGRPAAAAAAAAPSRATALAKAADSARLAADLDAERQKLMSLQSSQVELSSQLAQAKTQELSQRRELVQFSEEIENMKKDHRKTVNGLQGEVREREREVRELGEDLRVCREDLERERELVDELKRDVEERDRTVLEFTTKSSTMWDLNSKLQSQVDDYTSKLADLTLQWESAQREVEKMQREAMESEMIRRKLHNIVQELKGNIRVFCRVRPILPSDVAPAMRVQGGGAHNVVTKNDLESAKEVLGANMTFPDRVNRKEISLVSTSESATGLERKEVHTFSFDRVFEPESTQGEVFEEISQLAQSCIDGYNVCIFAYGQTGSGKSFTMEGGSMEATQGMIPRAVEQVFKTAEFMKTKGWEYKIEGQFLEIYNETINDLLSKSTSPSPTHQHQIKHNPHTHSTTVTDLTVVPLSSPTQVRALLAQAQSRRSVAATLMNERSSRSHSVFTLRIRGENVGYSPPPVPTSTGVGLVAIAGTGEKCEGCLNLVDLAGSERINVSFGNGFFGAAAANGAGPGKERVKETQNINKSLSALGDVIAALGEKGGADGRHVPYRNSKLTYLLQNSLSGNSKTLMVLNLSPLAAHMNESINSLRFATKVNNTQIGTAKKQAKIP